MKKTLDVLQRGIDQGLHPGAQLYVWHRGEVVIDTAIGQARPGVPMTADTRMLWMSACKPLTAIAVLRQVARGTIALDTSIVDVIPEFAQNGKSAITVGHCLMHTAGFRGPLNSFTPGPWEAIIERCCALRLEPQWTPGEKAGYHVASSWFILGELLQRVDGRLFERIIASDVLLPANATSTSFTLSAAEAESDAFARVEPDSLGNAPDDVARPPASARGPIRDLAQVYISLVRHDGRLLPAEWSRAMIARQREGMIDQTFKEKVDWGLGVKLDSKRYGQLEQYGYGPHASDSTFGHSGNQCSCAFADPQHDLVVAWCTNGMPGESQHQSRQNAINAAIYEDLGIV